MSFRIDDLPVHYPPLTEDGDCEPLNRAMRSLVEIIWQIGGFRFKHTKTRYSAEPVYEYHCSQDQMHQKPELIKRKRDRERMERFDCQSKLDIRPNLASRTLQLSLSHQYHNPYEDNRLTPQILEFIEKRRTKSMPAEIYRELRADCTEGYDKVIQSQIYYRWQQANSALWRRNPDPMESALLLLQEQSSRCSFRRFRHKNVAGLAIYNSKTIRALAPTTLEAAMDATYGTNNAGMSLTAVLAEFDNTGIPLAYLFMQVTASASKRPGVDQEAPKADQGATTAVLYDFLLELRELGLNPTFMGTDKDLSELSAIAKTWPGCSIQLCYWHVKRAIRTKLNTSSSTKTIANYHPDGPLRLIPELEPCWGTTLNRRLVAHKGDQQCECVSRSVVFSDSGKVETNTPELRDTVLQMICKHFNAHPLIPDELGCYRTADLIHRESATQAYRWCRSHNYYRLWAYLWKNWYCFPQWKLWARSCNESEIPRLKTTMIVESHWRKLKHDYLHRFNRPRIDLVVWIILDRVVPDSIAQLEALRGGNRRQGSASWRKTFKRQWDDLWSLEVSSESLSRYHTNPSKWTCGCPSFLESRFLICKHIVQCYEPITDVKDRILFFSTVQRQRSSPFWKHDKLVLLPQFQPAQPAQATIESTADEEGFSNDSEPEDEPEFNVDESFCDDDEKENDPVTYLWTFEPKMTSVIEMYKEQLSGGNVDFARRVFASQQSNWTLLEEVTAKRNKQTTPTTWGRKKHPATMYYR